MVIFLANPQNRQDLASRPDELSIFNPIWTHNSEKEVIEAGIRNTFLNGQMFFFLGDKNRRHNIGRLPALDFPLNILALYGIMRMIISILKKIRGKANTLRVGNCEYKWKIILLGLPISLLPAILTYQGSPHFLRGYGSIVFITIICAHLMDKFLSNRVIVLCISLSITFSLYKTFYWGFKGDLIEVFGNTQYSIAQDIATTSKGPIYILSAGSKNMVVEYLNAKKGKPLSFLDRIEFEDKLKNIETTSGVFFIPKDSDEIKYFDDTLRYALQKPHVGKVENNYFIKITSNQ